MINEYPIQLSSICNYKQTTIPPWSSPNVEIDLSFSENIKSNTSSDEYKSKFNQKMNEDFESYIKLYTDG